MYKDILVKKEQLKDMRRDIEARRLRRELLAANKAHNPRFYRRASGWLGGRLAAWGRRLQISKAAAKEGKVAAPTAKRETPLYRAN